MSITLGHVYQYPCVCKLLSWLKPTHVHTKPRLWAWGFSCFIWTIYQPFSAHVSSPPSTFPLCLPPFFFLIHHLTLALNFLFPQPHTHTFVVVSSLDLSLIFFVSPTLPFLYFSPLPLQRFLPPLLSGSRSLSVSSVVPWHLPPPLSASAWRHSNRSVRSRACLSVPIILSNMTETARQMRTRGGRVGGWRWQKGNEPHYSDV